MIDNKPGSVSPLKRLAMRLARIHGASYSQLARAADVSENTVKEHVRGIPWQAPVAERPELERKLLATAARELGFVGQLSPDHSLAEEQARSVNEVIKAMRVGMVYEPSLQPLMLLLSDLVRPKAAAA
jgi:hypothetical protein